MVRLWYRVQALPFYSQALYQLSYIVQPRLASPVI